MNELEKIIDMHTCEINEIKATVNKLVIDLNIFINENKHLHELSSNIKKAVNRLEEQTDQTILRFKMFDKEQERKANFWQMIGKHWWKIAAISVPIVGFLFEMGIYLRNLPPMPR